MNHLLEGEWNMFDEDEGKIENENTVSKEYAKSAVILICKLV